MSSSNPYPWNSEIHKEEETEKSENYEGLGDTRRTRPSKLTEQNSYELTEMEAASTGPTWAGTRSFVYILYFLFSIFMFILNMWESGSLFLVTSLGSFIFFSSVGLLCPALREWFCFVLCFIFFYLVAIF